MAAHTRASLPARPVSPGTAASAVRGPGTVPCSTAGHERICCVRLTFRTSPRGSVPMYKEFLGEVVVWLIPIVILVGIALLVTSHA
ncbi:hypothetical protein GCM10011574_64750 [Microbispora bryophytorum]|uniref:Uncharacterized protein n=1 Tax=Microbispora bryophytorum TaxID=1460882 RepID=A0A8H9H4Z3_9ACTN|nr:hypothetical protein GCM10011574_64750 [Microbispora bryophytorum]